MRKALAALAIAAMTLPLGGCYTMGYYTGKVVHTIIPSSQTTTNTTVYTSAPQYSAPAPETYSAPEPVAPAPEAGGGDAPSPSEQAPAGESSGDSPSESSGDSSGDSGGY